MTKKTYKGFNKDMTCRGYQFEEGKEYKHDGEVNVCSEGFHACEAPLECFRYYSPATSVYHEVEQSGDISVGYDDTKVASSVIKIGGRLDIIGLVKAHFEYVKAHITTEHTDPEQATAGSYGAATSRGTAAVGRDGIACARGNECKVKGGLGAILVVAEENKENYDIKSWCAEVVDGERIKADVWHRIVDGEFVEAEEES